VPPNDPSDRVLQRRRAVGERIRQVRLHRNLTQERLAEFAGMDRQAINRLENGHTSPMLDTLIRLADALDVDLAELVQLPRQ
jgi:transcriptional regulator with XRE-family HTH domain